MVQKAITLGAELTENYTICHHNWLYEFLEPGDEEIIAAYVTLNGPEPHESDHGRGRKLVVEQRRGVGRRRRRRGRSGRFDANGVTLKSACLIPCLCAWGRLSLCVLSCVARHRLVGACRRAVVVV